MERNLVHEMGHIAGVLKARAKTPHGDSGLRIKMARAMSPRVGNLPELDAGAAERLSTALVQSGYTDDGKALIQRAIDAKVGSEPVKPLSMRAANRHKPTQ